MSYNKHYPGTTTCSPVLQILSSKFYPFPTVKPVRKNPERKVIYDVAHYMFRNHPLDKPLRIYQYQSNQLSYDYYIERTHTGWKDTVFTHPVTSKENKVIYIIDGLSQAITEEKEMQPLLWHMAQQINMMCRLLEI